MVDFLAEDSNDFLGLSCGRAHVAQLCDELRASGYSCSWAGHSLESDSHGGAVAYLLHGLDAGCWRSSGSRWRSGSGVVGWGLRLSLGGIWRQQVFGGELRVVVGRTHARLHLLPREAHAAQLGDGLPPQGQGEGAAGDILKHVHGCVLQDKVRERRGVGAGRAQPARWCPTARWCWKWEGGWRRIQ